MTSKLEERLLVTRNTLVELDGYLDQQSKALPSDVRDRFKQMTAFASEVDGLITLLHAREEARGFLTDLEKQADEKDIVPYGAARAKFQHVRQIGVQGYLSLQWALADRLGTVASKILCDTQGASCPLMSYFVLPARKNSTPAVLLESIRQPYGWPIGISYALRNVFHHEGAPDFFAGHTALSKFAISEIGWKAAEFKVINEYKLESTHHHRLSIWPANPRDDLRAVLDICTLEMDDALGVLVGSASKMFASHVGYMLGQD